MLDNLLHIGGWSNTALYRVVVEVDVIALVTPGVLKYCLNTRVALQRGRVVG